MAARRVAGREYPTRDLDLFSRDLQQLIREMPGEIGAVVAEATGEMEQAVRRKCGEVTTQRTGNLLAGIAADVRQTAATRHVGMVKNTAPHTTIVEYGTAPRAHKSGKSTGVMPELAPLRKAFDENERRIASRASEKILALLEQRIIGR